MLSFYRIDISAMRHAIYWNERFIWANRKFGSNGVTQRTRRNWKKRKRRQSNSLLQSRMDSTKKMILLLKPVPVQNQKCSRKTPMGIAQLACFLFKDNSWSYRTRCKASSKLLTNTHCCWRRSCVFIVSFE